MFFIEENKDNNRKKYDGNISVLYCPVSNKTYPAFIEKKERDLVFLMLRHSKCFLLYIIFYFLQNLQQKLSI